MIGKSVTVFADLGRDRAWAGIPALDQRFLHFMQFVLVNLAKFYIGAFLGESVPQLQRILNPTLVIHENKDLYLDILNIVSGIHTGFEIQSRCHQKQNTAIPVAPQKCPSNIKTSFRSCF